MELNRYQHRANLTDQRPIRDGQSQLEEEMALVYPLMGMSSEVGSLLTQYKKHVRDGEAHQLFADRVSEKLGDILWYISNMAAKLDLDLEGIAAQNLERIEERWPVEGQQKPAKLLDDDYPDHEQLPRRVNVRFQEIDDDDGIVVRIFRDDEQLGNDLTDMNYYPDDYRFHDVFHLTYAALLGWSPISRVFFETRRDSHPAIREVEDGGRAGVIEEGISALIFEYARKENFYEGVDQLPSELLANVKGMVSHLEVRVRTTRDWEEAILRSFEIWREMRKYRSGIVKLDLLERTIEFKPPAS